MFRAFDEHIIRKTELLDGAWSFVTDPDDVGESELYFRAMSPKCEKVYVPSVWNNKLGLLDYLGAAWYYKEFYSDGEALRLRFGAVMTKADIWVDGEHVGSHYGGFTAFSVYLPTLGAGKHLLAVKVDNRFDGASVPEAACDWYHYGGIIRSVAVETLRGICIMSFKQHSVTDTNERTATLRCEVKLKNFSSTAQSTALHLMLDGTSLHEGSISLDAYEELDIVTDAVKLENIRIWDVGSPQLYTVTATTDTDDLIDRIGFREIKTDKGKIYLNGKKLTVKGVCRHEEHPDLGFAFPEALMQRDLDIIKNMGANAIRGSHYPNSKYFVDLLDENGLLFWSEIPIWGHGYTTEMLGDPVFIERGLNMLREMSDQYFNHPCIVIWGIHNEIDSHTENGLRLTSAYYSEMKALNDGRLVTYATDKPMTDICMQYCDVISINKYCGWYEGDKHAWDACIDSFKVRRGKLGLQDKPVLFSEFGAAAIYGHHTFDCIKWTEEFQAELIGYAIRRFMEDDMVCGCFIWQFCDIRTSEEMGLNRARGFNNKGLLNEYRRPKLAYQTVRELYSEKNT